VSIGVAQTAESGPQSNIDGKLAAITADWESLPGVFDDIGVYTGQIRDLVQIGKPAIPALTAALDRTKRDSPMRLLAFTLRAIGDARAVPALIREFTPRKRASAGTRDFLATGQKRLCPPNTESKAFPRFF
jgi:hypothetical protein